MTIITENPNYHTKIFEYKNWIVRMDKYPWLDLTDKNSIGNSHSKCK
jgi:hypothetical protein